MKRKGLDFDDPLHLNSKFLPNTPLSMPRLEHLHLNDLETGDLDQENSENNLDEEILKEFKTMTA